MDFLENKWLIAIIGFAVFYLAYKIFSGVNKNEKLYQEHLDKIITSDENKVKGRFE